MKIEIKNLTKIYGNSTSAVVALSELDLAIAENEICIVRGPNGSGKTTLISILSGDLSQSAGQVKLVSSAELNPRIAVINQFNNLISELTVGEHFEILGLAQNKNLIATELLDKKPTEISRGQAQLVAIALALSPDTDLLLADEPTGALGHEDSELVYQFIKQTAIKNNCSVILVTHDQAAEKIADRVVRLRDGRISETWIPGTSEKQVVNSKGWVKLPDQVVSGLASEIAINPTSTGALIDGRISQPVATSENLSKRNSNVDTVLKAINLTTKYGQENISTELNFEVSKNQIFVISGKSGSGKTTLLKSINGAHQDYSGEFIFGNSEQIPYFNIENLFGLELTLKELNVSEEIISRLQLSDLANRQIQTFSGGQKQRALVAIALSNSAEVILLDEPTSALDEEMTYLVLQAILNSDKTVIAATHDERLVQIANNVINL